MKTAIAKIKGVAPYSQSRVVTEPKGRDESHDDFRQRTWKLHLHTNAAGNIIIPPTAFKNCLSEAAKYLSIQVPGKGKATYTKSFEAGVLCADPVDLGIKKDDVQSETLHLPADGKRGSGARVWKTFPFIPEGWTGEVKFHILDEILLNKFGGGDDTTVFEHVLNQAGAFIGIGRFRPKNNGFYGRFVVESLAIQ